MGNTKSLTVLVFLLTLRTAVEATTLSELYFANNDNIMRLTAGSSTVVFSDLTLVDYIDCNICDRMVYWLDHSGSIKRADPANPTDVKTVVDDDLNDPKGLAVDWIGNNIYFSHGVENKGRIEVVNCDSGIRRVLAHNLNNVGSIAINVATGYLYYVENNFVIWRMWLNGNESDRLYEDYGIDENYLGFIVGLEIDVNSNTLYWTNNIKKGPFGIKYLNLSSIDQVPVEQRMAQVINTSSAPYELTIYNNTLYWTEPNVKDISEQEIIKPGALYSMNIGTDVVTLLLRNNTLSPHDLCYFYNSTMPPSGCALNNGGCSSGSFCFTVPAIGGGTTPQCGCPTGIVLTPQGTCPKFPSQFLLFTQEHNSLTFGEVSHTDVRIISLDIPDQFIDVLTPITIEGTSAKFLAYDITQHKVYWSQQEPPLIKRASLDGDDEEILIQTSISLPESLAVDPYAMNLYWVDSKLDKIEVYHLENKNRKVLIRTGLKPQGLAIDLRNRYLYWTDLEQNMPTVERCHLDGTGREVIPNINVDKIRQPVTITVDPLTDYSYWAEVEHDKIFRYNGVTEMHTELTIQGAGDVSGLAVHGEYLYWTDRSGVGASLGRVNKVYGSDLLQILDIGGLHGILATNNSAETISIDCTMCDQLCLSSNTPTSDDITPICACADHFEKNSQGGGCTDPLAFVMLGTNSNVSPLKEVPLNKWQDITDAPKIDTSVLRMDVDVSNNIVYWINAQDKLIYRSNSTEAIGVVTCCVGSTEDLAVDWFGKNLYWTDSSRRVIEVSHLDGQHRLILYKIPEYLGAPKLITLDPLRGHLYWSPVSKSKIYRMSMSGDTVLEDVDVFWESDEHLEVFGMAISYTSEAGIRDQLYWGVNTNASRYRLFSKDVHDKDSSVVSFVPPPQGVPQGVTLAAYKGHFFVLELSGTVKIVEQNNGAVNFNLVYSPTIFIIEGGILSDFSIVHHSIQPGEHECSFHECGGGAVCLVTSGVRGECVCPPLEARVDETNNNGVPLLTCASTETFLLIATENSIYHLPVTSPQSPRSSSTVQPIPLGVVGTIETLAYDPINKSVLYTDNSSLLHSVALNSSFETSFPLPGDLRPSSLAYDWMGGHVFSAERGGFQIDLMTINNQGVGSVLDFDQDKRYALNILGEVVFDSDATTLYWTYLASTHSNLGVELHYMNLLDNTKTEQTINLGDRRIEKLTLEQSTKTLYWVNHPASGRVEIEKYDIRTGASVRMYSGTGNIVALASAVVGDVPYLFWFDQAMGIIYSHDGTDVQEYRRWNPGNVNIVGMLGHKTASSLPNRPCLGDSRPCSHYCLPGSGSSDSNYQCACPAFSQLTNGNTCSPASCGPLLRSCGDMFDECYPRTYWCDNIQHCRNGADETCNCSLDSFACYLSTSECVSMSAKCDGISDCSEGEDELDCCTGNEFGCYVLDDTNDPLAGRVKPRYNCLNNQSICDDIPDCFNSSIDEPSTCPKPSTDPPNPTPANAGNIPVIITAVIVACVAIAFVTFLFCYCIRVIVRKKQEYLTSSTMTRALNFNLSYKPRDSPQQRGDSLSDYCSDCTNTTQIGNGSSVSQNSTFKRHSAAGLSTDPSNPPPSPMTLRHSPTALTDIEDDGSVFSEPISEYPIPPVPNPSLNYDIVSDNLSYSVSQSQYPATISGRAPNPLLFQQQRQYGHPHYHNGGYHPPPPQGNQWNTNVDKIDPHHTNGKYLYSTNNSYHHYPPTHPRKELDSLARTETESTISMTTVSTENQDEYQFEEMSYAPPGRPPSPVTVVSDYHPPPAPPMSPDSTLSELSDECSERHLHQT